MFSLRKPKPEAPVAIPPVCDFLKFEEAFLDAVYQIQRTPFLVRQGGKWRPLHDGELARFVRLYLQEIGRTDLWSDALIADVQSFLRAGGA